MYEWMNGCCYALSHCVPTKHLFCCAWHQCWKWAKLGEKWQRAWRYGWRANTAPGTFLLVHNFQVKIRLFALFNRMGQADEQTFVAALWWHVWLQGFTLKLSILLVRPDLPMQVMKIRMSAPLQTTGRRLQFWTFFHIKSSPQTEPEHIKEKDSVPAHCQLFFVFCFQGAF